MAWLNQQKRMNKKTGKKEPYWAIRWRDQTGKTHTRAVGFSTRSEAKKALKVFEGKQAAGEPVEPPTPTAPGSWAKQKAPTLGDYLDQAFLPAVRRDKSNRTAEVAENAAKALKTILEPVRLDQINFALVDAYLSERRELGRKSRTLILELNCLKQALRHAHDCEVIAAVPKLPTLKDNDRRPHRFLTAEESVMLLDAVRPLDKQPHKVTRGRPPQRRDRLSYLAILMALNTGARRGEILTRRWEDIRWDQGKRGALVIGPREEIDYQVKTRRTRLVPLTPELRSELQALNKDLGAPAQGWIFPSPTNPQTHRKNFRKALVRSCERAGITPIHPHGLRHTWASRLAMAGVDRRTLMELGGWKEGRMLDEIYAHVTDSHKDEVMGSMGIASSQPATSPQA